MFLATDSVGASIVFGLLRLVDRFIRAEPGDRILIRVLPAIAAVAAVDYLVTGPGGLRRSPLRGALVAEVVLRRLRRTNPRGFALVSLLDVFAESSRPVCETT